MTESGSLFESLFEIVDCSGQHELAGFAVLNARVDSGVKPTVDGGKGELGHPVPVVQFAVQPGALYMITRSKQPIASVDHIGLE